MFSIAEKEDDMPRMRLRFTTDAQGEPMVTFTATARDEEPARDAGFAWRKEAGRGPSLAPSDLAAVDVADMLNNAPHWFTRAVLRRVEG